MALLVFVLAFALLTVLAIWTRRKAPRFYVFAKLAPMLLILALYLAELAVRDGASAFPLWILAGLVFGIVGDALTPFERTVKPGILAFALGHVFYLIAAVWHAHVAPVWLWIAALLPGLAFAAFLVRRTEQKQYAPLIWIYGPLIAVMAGAGLWLDYAAGGGFGLFASGVLLFVLSDGFWSWNRFIQKFDWASAAILSTYYAAQACIAAGAIRLL